jgi:UrcA family protein
MNAVVIRSALALALTAAIGCAAAPARADRINRINGEVTVTSAPTITVSFAELDISKPRGLEVLYSRIEHAAKAVCGLEYSMQLARTRVAKTCYKTAIDDAVRQINRPTLTALHLAKTRSALG